MEGSKGSSTQEHHGQPWAEDSDSGREPQRETHTGLSKAWGGVCRDGVGVV